MPFRKRFNRHDAWLRCRDAHAAVFAEAGLPPEVLESATKFSEFLTKGHCGKTGFQLDSLSDKDFGRVFQFVTSHFDYDAVDFSAMEQRRLRGEIA